MTWKNEATEAGELSEREFVLSVSGRTVPGIYWSPAGAERLVLLGHGGIVEIIGALVRRAGVQPVTIGFQRWMGGQRAELQSPSDL